MLSETQYHKTYFERNSRWLYPLLVSCLLLASLILLERFGLASIIDPMLVMIGVAFGVGLTGFYAHLTDTLSAKIICNVIIIGSIAFAVISLLSS